MSLSPANVEVLRNVRAALLRRGSRIVDLSLDELKQVHQAEEAMDARSYARWAAQRMVISMRLSQETLIAARMWYEKKLRRGYLVQKEFVAHAFVEAVKFAGMRKHGQEN